LLLDRSGLNVPCLVVRHGGSHLRELRQTINVVFELARFVLCVLVLVEDRC
jgi:hypothetical protein